MAQRVSIDCVKNVNEAKRAIKKGFKHQINKQGFSIIEVISSCPTNWGMRPIDSLTWVRENMLKYYPLGIYKDTVKEEK